MAPHRIDAALRTLERIEKLHSLSEARSRTHIAINGIMLAALIHFVGMREGGETGSIYLASMGVIFLTIFLSIFAIFPIAAIDPRKRYRYDGVLFFKIISGYKYEYYENSWTKGGSQHLLKEISDSIFQTSRTILFRFRLNAAAGVLTAVGLVLAALSYLYSAGLLS